MTKPSLESTDGCTPQKNEITVCVSLLSSDFSETACFGWTTPLLIFSHA
jgi:hypothetical protein